jgi:hypothetical protein
MRKFILFTKKNDFIPLQVLIVILGLTLGSAQAGALSNQGALLGVRLVANYTAAQTSSTIKKYYSGTGQDVNDLIKSATAVKAYAITYSTLDAAGRATIASGLVGFPSPASGVYPLVQYHHGTQFDNRDVPSNLTRSAEAALSLSLFAAHGFVTSLPDYLGQGFGTPPHPYLHARSMATASTDMLKAVAQLCAKLKIRTYSRLFITGLSEGGHATLALQRLIEADRTVQPFRLIASAPIAGPYNLRETWKYLSMTNPVGSSPLILHLYLSYRRLYQWNEPLNHIFIPPYDTRVMWIDNGTRNGHEMYGLLPKTSQAMMQPTFLAAVASGKHPIDEALEGNNTYNFPPMKPTRLYHAQDDELVPFTMSEMACSHMKLLGGNDVSVVNLGPGIGHEDSFVPATLKAFRWFNTFPFLRGIEFSETNTDTITP